MFDVDRVHSVYLDIPPASWSAIHAEAIPNGCVPHDRAYYSGTLRFEDQVFEGVGIRVKGGCGSARNLDGKAGFKVNLSWDDPAVPGCPDTRRLFGLKRLTLNNLVQDRTFSHERLGYPIYKRLGVATPRTAHILVYVNDELWGLYNHIETIDRRFLTRWFDDNGGDMYEGTYWCDLLPENVPPVLDDTYCLRRSFGAGECSGDSDYQPLRDLVQSIAALPDGGFYPEVESFFEFDTFLSSWAVDTVLSHWDAYEFTILNNYRVYRDPSTMRWTLIPHGIDQTFADTIDGFDPSGILARRCIDEPDCEAAFAARVHAAVEAFEALELSEEAIGLDSLIREHVEADPRKELGIGEYDALVVEMRQWIVERPEVVRDELSARGF
jgi:spore coat protein CotH